MLDIRYTFFQFLRSKWQATAEQSRGVVGLAIAALLFSTIMASLDALTEYLAHYPMCAINTYYLK